METKNLFILKVKAATKKKVKKETFQDVRKKQKEWERERQRTSSLVENLREGERKKIE